ncbi:MAG: tetratricopeptide repeat protein, partial [Proteobacteria bacterium]|nr:tetratricopeptide repeat protein [Pseudomonadota bacterium]
MTRRILRVLAAVGLLLAAGCTAPAPPDAENLPAAARETWQIAEAGDPVAQTVLGNMFEARVFGRPDYGAAAQWYDRAVRQGDPLAAFYLAGLFERGQGVPLDGLSAANLYRAAARSGNAAAAFKLGFLYEKGLGVPQDFALARQWYDEAQNGWVMQGLTPMQPAYLTADA